ncbi:hypothetical protein QBC39DRAFT_350549 [Podospora conica]|nr:hypothetical protein QBC39DRAFT_350549 [Schizothecium conicum]
MEGGFAPPQAPNQPETRPRKRDAILATSRRPRLQTRPREGPTDSSDESESSVDGESEADSEGQIGDPQPRRPRTTSPPHPFVDRRQGNGSDTDPEKCRERALKQLNLIGRQSWRLAKRLEAIDIPDASTLSNNEDDEPPTPWCSAIMKLDDCLDSQRCTDMRSILGDNYRTLATRNSHPEPHDDFSISVHDPTRETSDSVNSYTPGRGLFSTIKSSEPLPLRSPPVSVHSIRVEGPHLLLALKAREVRRAHNGADTDVTHEIQPDYFEFWSPFRLFVCREKELRRVKEGLERAFDVWEKLLASEGQEPGKMKPEKPAATKHTCLKTTRDDQPELKFIPSLVLASITRLLDWWDDIFLPRINYITKGSPGTRVVFSELWHLFRPGATVIEETGKQAFLVEQVRMPTLRHPSYQMPVDIRLPGQPAREMDAEYEPDNPSKSFYVRCIRVDFNGVQFGPAMSTYRIRPFGGEKTVTSLPVFPLRDWTSVEIGRQLEVDQQDQTSYLRQRLEARGRKFVELTSAASKHMYYAGLTFESRVNIKTEVIVDWNTAFDYGGLPVDLCPAINQLPGNLDSWEIRCEGEAPPRPHHAWHLEHPRNRRPGEFEPRYRLRPQWLQTSHPLDGSSWEEHDDDCRYDLESARDYFRRRVADMSDRQMPSLFVCTRDRADVAAGGNDLTQDELLVMSNRAYGFALRTRSWEILDVDCCHDVNFQKEGLRDMNQKERNVGSAFDQLVLPEEHRYLLQSLVSQFFRNRAKGTRSDTSDKVDIVQGKGNGLIFLLHGAPGLGKTTTAEGIAEHFKRPLIQLTCGDLGSGASEVEGELKRLLHLSSLWGCVLLIDEADVFLASRSREDMKRNALVAVFLRLLEYHTGVLFLTTNRVGDFDEAFASRIHLSLYFPALNIEGTLKVFDNNFNLMESRFRAQGRRININKPEIIRYAREFFAANEKARLNGRQIRNACTTALAMAESHLEEQVVKGVQAADAAVCIDRAQFETLGRMSLQFSHYLRSAKRGFAEDVAYESRFRGLDADVPGEETGNKRDGVGKTVGVPAPPQPGWPPSALASHLHHQVAMPVHQQQSFLAGGTAPTPSFYPYINQQQAMGIPGQSAVYQHQMQGPQQVIRQARPNSPLPSPGSHLPHLRVMPASTNPGFGGQSQAGGPSGGYANSS